MINTKKILKSDTFISVSFSVLTLALGIIIGRFYTKDLLKLFLPVFLCFFSIIPIIIYKYLNNKTKNNPQIKAYLILASTFLIRLAYIIYTLYYIRQHDMCRFNDTGDGHAGYIEYIYTHLSLPDFDPRTVYQFYHPPLSHAISALWLHVQKFFGISHENAIEGLQFLPLIYSCLIYLTSYKIFREFKLKGRAMTLALFISAYCPTFIIMSGSINNDILSVLFCMTATLYTVRWCRNPSVKNIIFIAFSIGLGMMTKLSVALIAVPVGLCFLYVFIRSKNNRKKIFVSFIIFGAICIPLGLYWSVSNYIKYGMPLNYVPMLSMESKQYVGNIPAMQRLFDFSLYQFKYLFKGFYIYPDFMGIPAYNEFNPTIALLKTLNFGEFYLTGNDEIIIISGYLIMIITVILIICAIAGSLTALIKNKKFKNRKALAMILIYSFLMFISYYVFSFQYPHACTTNIRYCVPLIIFAALFIGILYDNLKNKYAKSFVSVSVILYSVLSVVIYSSLGLLEVIRASGLSEVIKALI